MEYPTIAPEGLISAISRAYCSQEGAPGAYDTAVQNDNGPVVTLWENKAHAIHTKIVEWLQSQEE